MHFYFKVLHGQSWIFSTMLFYVKILIELRDGECIHQFLQLGVQYLALMFF